MDFLGLYKHSLDAKNRIFIPSKYREYLGGTFVICPGADKSLYVYSIEEWEKVAAQVKALGSTPELRRYKRSFFERADMVELDKQGRFTIKAELKEYAHLDKDIVIAGSGNKFEIWDAESYEEETRRTLSADDLDIEVIF
ncbi:MAG: division/cell wall cluster transcriptional repressor MraZ [Ruminococcaceae bacterium]|nr:division/cell wall cluster transcriptional repressor MraZ [Oscillospiraceae bacterium]